MLPNKNEGRVKIWAGSSSEGNSGNRRGSTRFHSTDRKISEELVNRLVSDLKETTLVWKTSSRYRRNKRASGRLWLQILNHLWVTLTHKLITFSVFIGAFSSEAFKSWVEIQEIWNMWGKNRRIVFILGWDATVCAPIVDMKWRETDWNTLSDPVKTVCMSWGVDFFGITRNHDVREASDTRNLKNQKTSDLWRALKTFPSHFQHVVFSWIHLVLTSWLLMDDRLEKQNHQLLISMCKSPYFPFPIVVPYRRCVGVRFKDFTRPRLDKL